MPGLSDPRAEVVVEEGRHRDQRVLVGEARPPLEERLRQLADVRLARALLLDRPVSDDEDALRRPARQVLHVLAVGLLLEDDRPALVAGRAARRRRAPVDKQGEERPDPPGQHRRAHAGIHRESSGFSISRWAGHSSSSTSAPLRQLHRRALRPGQEDQLPHPFASSGTPSKKDTVPVSSEYSAPTTSRPSRAISRSSTADPWRR